MTSDTGVGAAAGEGGVGRGTGIRGGKEWEGGDRGGGVILRRFGALSHSPPSVSSSLPRLSSRGLSVVVSTITGETGAVAPSLLLTMAGVGAGIAGEDGNGEGVVEEGKGGGDPDGRAASGA